MSENNEAKAKSTVTQEPQHVCIICGKDTTAKRMSGKPRWHKSEEGFLCHYCYEKSRDREEPTS